MWYVPVYIGTCTCMYQTLRMPHAVLQVFVVVVFGEGVAVAVEFFACFLNNFTSH